jgi:vacuolar iron transporter family protein
MVNQADDPIRLWTPEPSGPWKLGVRGRLQQMDENKLTPADIETKAQLPRLLDARRRLTKGNDLLPHRGPTAGDKATVAGKSGALRAAIFGINDGLLTNTALIMAFVGASQTRGVILLAGISGLLAGAFSMSAGEYVSMKVQREMLERVLHLEAHEIGTDPELERKELADLYVHKKGLPRDLADQVATEIMKDPKVALDTHAREELGLDPDGGLGSPGGAAVSSFVMFSIGALVPLLPFFFTGGHRAEVIAGILAAIAISVVGALTSRLTGRGALYSGVRMLAIGAGAATITYLIGSAVGVRSTG